MSINQKNWAIILRLVLLSLLLSQTAFAHSKFPQRPLVQLVRYYPNPDPNQEVPPLTEEELKCAEANDPSCLGGTDYSTGEFPRLLGYSEEKIKAYILNGGDFPATEFRLQLNKVDYSFKTIQKGNLSFLVVKFSGVTNYSYKTAYRPMAVYLLKNNLSIGYALMDDLGISSSVKQPFPALTQILNGKRNDSLSHKINHQGHHLRKEAGQIKKTEFEFVVFDLHPKHSDYIEQYGLVVDSKAKDYFKKLPYEICLDAFYPEKYEKEMEEQILQWVPTLAYTFGD